MTEKTSLSSGDRVTKAYLIASLMADQEFSRADAAKAVEGVIDAIVTALGAGMDVNISNVGTLRPRVASARPCRNPQTGESWIEGSKNTVRWTPSPTLIDFVNGSSGRRSLSRKAPQSR